MQDTQKILSVQDISCFGQCSNTVMLPMLSAAGLETVVLPTALLSTHTGGFRDFTFLDTTAEMEKILSHFRALSLRFSYLCTGYFGSPAQISLLEKFLPALLTPDARRMIDPVMGDHGKLYPTYTQEFVQEMRRLCRGADLITPNLTEACLLADMPYFGAEYDKKKTDELFCRLQALGAHRVVLTGVMFDDHTIGTLACEEGKTPFVTKAPYVDRHFHGTGDTLMAALIAYLVNGVEFEKAVAGAVAFVSDCIADTVPVMQEHWYGLRFEGHLSKITKLIK